MKFKHKGGQNRGKQIMQIQKREKALHRSMQRLCLVEHCQGQANL